MHRAAPARRPWIVPATAAEGGIHVLMGWFARPVAVLLLAAGGLASGLAVPAGAQTPAIQVSAGAYHTCAILVTGNVKCWGQNTYGQLGLGDTVHRGTVPGQMGAALPEILLAKTGPIALIAAGAYHTCVLDANGNVRCWGRNTYGQLGYGHANNLGDNPNEVGGGLAPAVSETQKIVAGFYHTCALKHGGAVWCWGHNLYGQLGTGDTQNRRDGVNNVFAVPSLGTGRTAVDIAATRFSTCALLDNSQVKCWGYNFYGSLGLGDTANRGDDPFEMGDFLPATDIGLTGWPIKQLIGGGYHVCAVRANNSWPKCWGYNQYGQLGLGDTLARGDNPGEMGSTLLFLPSGSNTPQIALGGYHTCVSAWTGFAGRQGIKCFGYNADGQLGVGDTASRGDNPGEVAFGSPPNADLGIEAGSGFPYDVLGMTAGTYHTCALLEGGIIKCWGYNFYGQLGLGDTASHGTASSQMGAALPVVDL